MSLSRPRTIRVSVDKVKKVLPQLASLAEGAPILRQATQSFDGLGGIFGKTTG